MSRPFIPSLSWLVNEYEHLYMLFQQMIVRMPSAANEKKYHCAFKILTCLYESMIRLAKLIELWDASIPSVQQSPSFREKIRRCSRMRDKMIESYENEVCRQKDIFDSLSLDCTQGSSES